MTATLTDSAAIRRLTAIDLPEAFALSSQAGWNQTALDWSTLLELAPDSCFVLDCSGQLAATATLVCYGETLAWLGMVLTKAEFRRRGFARLLVQHALNFGDLHGIKSVKLDATNQGQPLYQSLGFVAEREIERWSGPGLPRQPFSSPAQHLDWKVIPQDRRPLFEWLARRNPLIGDGNEFVMHRDGIRASYLGPCRAHSKETAARLVKSALAHDSGPWLWDLFPDNPSAVALATSLGFQMQRQLVRMCRGVPLREDETATYAIAGFEFG